MNPGQLDSRTIERVSGPAWRELRSTFDRLASMLLAVSDTARGDLTTIYVKFTSAESGEQPFAVVWLKKSSELTVGLALPESIVAAEFVEAPPKCIYAGLTRYLVVRSLGEVPERFAEWAVAAHKQLSNT